MTTLTEPTGRQTWPPRRDQRPVHRAILVAILATLALAAIYLYFVVTPSGQELDQVALNHLADGKVGRHTIAGWLRNVTVAAVVAVLAGIVVISWMRRRFRLGILAAVLVAGANVSSQALKHVVLYRPHLGHGWTNSLPSGHATVVTSLVLAFVLVVPRGWRGPVTLIGTVAVVVAGVGTVVANWHRPSDVIAAYAVCLAWGAITLAIVSATTPPPQSQERPRVHSIALIAGLAIAAGVFTQVIGIRLNGTQRDLMIHAVIMCGIAVCGAIAVGTFTKMANARTS